MANSGKQRSINPLTMEQLDFPHVLLIEIPQNNWWMSKASDALSSEKSWYLYTLHMYIKQIKCMHNKLHT